MMAVMISVDVLDFERSSFPMSLSQSGGECLIRFGQFVSTPFFFACEKLALAVLAPGDGRIFSVFARCIGAMLFTVFGVAALTGWLVGGCLKMAGAYLTGRPFMYVGGEGKEQWGDEFSLMTFNVCMYESGYPMILGGVMPARLRMDGVADLIKASRAEMVVLQELSLGPSEELIERLKGEYPHFYTNVGNPGAWLQHTLIGPELFIASKAPIVSEPRFVPYVCNEKKLGFFCLETPNCWIINAHFPEEDQEAIFEEVSREAARLKDETGKGSVLAGDLNYRKPIPESLFHDAREFTPTCGDEVNDFVLVNDGLGVREVSLVDCDLSDHKPILAKIQVGR